MRQQGTRGPAESLTGYYVFMLGCVSWIDPELWTRARHIHTPYYMPLIRWDDDDDDVIAKSVYLKSQHNRRVNSHHSRRWLFIPHLQPSTQRHSFVTHTLHYHHERQQGYLLSSECYIRPLSLSNNNNNNLILKWTQQFSTILFFSSVHHYGIFFFFFS